MRTLRSTAPASASRGDAAPPTWRAARQRHLLVLQGSLRPGRLPLDPDRFAFVVSPGLPAPRYRIHDATTHCPVSEGRAGPRVLNATSRAETPLTGDRIDLSALQSGRYLVVLKDGQAGPIVVGSDVDSGVLPLVTRFLAEQRCGPTTEAISLHAACHLFRSIPGAHSADGVIVDDGARPPYGSASRVDAEGAGTTRATTSSSSAPRLTPSRWS